jgi:2-oxoglutarate ferredoxin oxidoreductase subunit alpha
LASLLRLDLPAEQIGKLRSVRHFNGLPIDARSVTDELVMQEGI